MSLIVLFAQLARLLTRHRALRGTATILFVLLSACNPTINDKKGEEYVAAQSTKKTGAFSDLTGSIANSQFPDGVVTSSKIDPAYTSTLATKTYADAYMMGYALPAISTFSANDSIRWNGSAWEVFTPGSAASVITVTATGGGGITMGGTATNPTVGISNLGVTTAMLAADAVTSAKILNGEIVNADINTAAAIDGSKVTPAFGAQNISTTGTISAGAATFSSLSLTSATTVANGGTGTTSLTNHGILLGQGTSSIVATAVMSNGQLLIGQTGADPVPTTVTGDVTITNAGVTAIGTGKVTTTGILDGTIATADIADAAVTYLKGGTGLSALPANGQLPIGNGAGYTLATLTGTLNQVSVTNTAGAITLAGPQNLHTGAAPTFAGMTLTGALSISASPGILPRSYLAGLGLSAAANSQTLTIAAGTARSDDNAMDLTLSSAWTKSIGNSWAALSGNGGLSAAAAAATATWYHVFLIGKPSTNETDVLITTIVSPTQADLNTATGTAGVWTKKRRIGSIRTEDGTTNILRFTQTGNLFYWYNVQYGLADTAIATTCQTYTLSYIPTGVPVKAMGIVSSGIATTNATLSIFMGTPGANCQTPTGVIYKGGYFDGIVGAYNFSAGNPLDTWTVSSTYFEMLTDSSANVQMSRSGTYDGSFEYKTGIQIYGWQDTRGRDD